MSNTKLQRINAHERDEHILFFEDGHKYMIKTDPKSKYTSVTTWVHQQFPKFNADEIISKIMSGPKWTPENKYWGMSVQDIKGEWDRNRDEAAKAGTEMHYQIECFMNGGAEGQSPSHKDLLVNVCDHQDNSKDWSMFLKFVEDFPELKPFRTEWMVYHEDLKLAGSIDMVYQNSDGTLSIYDWKRSKEITKDAWGKTGISKKFKDVPHSNFYHYSLQLNVYKYILEEKYGCSVKDLFLVRIHPDSDEYELIEVPVIDIFGKPIVSFNKCLISI